MNRLLKTTLAFLLSLLMIIGAFSTPLIFVTKASAAEGGVAYNPLPITVETVNANPGDTDVEVKVYIPTGWSGIGLTFHFDPAKLTYKSFVTNKAIQDQSAAGEPNVYALNKNNAASGKIIVSFASAIAVNGFEGYSNVDENGHSYDYFGTFKFNVSSGAKGLQEITVTVDKFVNSASENVEYTVTNGGIITPGSSQCEHNWGSWIITKAATYTETGIETRVCSRCGETETRTIPKLQDPSGIISIVVETVNANPGDTNVEVKVYIPTGWSGIGLTFHFDPAKLTYKSFVTNKAIQDQSAAGEPNVFALNKNNAANGEIIVSFASAVIVGGIEGYSNVDENGHSYDYFGTFKFNVSSGAKGLQEITVTVDKLIDSNSDVPFTATNGGITLPGTVCDHNWIETFRTNATCTDSGMIEYTCTICGTIKTVTISKLGHNWGNWRTTKPATYTETGIETRTCSRCSEADMRVIPKLSDPSGKVNIIIETVNAVAGRKGVNVKVFIPTGWSGIGLTFHFDPEQLTYKSFVTNKAIQDQSAAGEPNVFALNKNNAANGEIIVSFASAVIVGGIEGYSNVDYNGHTYDYLGTFTFDVAEGLKDSLCEITATLDKLVDPNGEVEGIVINGGVMIDSAECEHDWVEIGRTPATCTVPGKITYACSKCGDTKDEPIDIDPENHDWIEIGITPATCTSNGVITYACGNNPEHIKNEEIGIDPDAHAWGEWEVTTPATCAAKGEETRVCANDPTHIETREIEIDPNAHAWSEWTVTITATCLTHGEEARICKGCGSIETRETPLAPHNWSEWEVTVPNTYKSTGEEARICSVCSKIETRVLPVAQITDIELTALPITTVYIEGAELDLSGAVLTLYYDNNTSRTATIQPDGSSYKLFFNDEPIPEAFTFSGFSMETVGTQTVSIVYNGHSTSFTVDVLEKRAVSIEFTDLPSKIRYELYEPLNLNGSNIIITYNNGTTDTARLMSIAGYNRLVINSSSNSAGVEISGYDPYSVGVKTVTVEYQEAAASYNVIVGGMLGDIDFDGKLTVYDALLILRVAAKLDALSPVITMLGDIDGDGRITVYDALLILRVAAKLDEHL